MDVSADTGGAELDSSTLSAAFGAALEARDNEAGISTTGDGYDNDDAADVEAAANASGKVAPEDVSADTGGAELNSSKLSAAFGAALGAQDDEDAAVGASTDLSAARGGSTTDPVSELGAVPSLTEKEQAASIPGVNMGTPGTSSAPSFSAGLDAGKGAVAIARDVEVSRQQ